MTRINAKNTGSDRYFTGVPCQYGHVCERRTRDKKCVECRRDGVKKSRKTIAGKLRRSRQQTRWRATDRGKCVQHIAVMKWRRNNFEAHKSNQHARRARMAGASGKYTLHDIEELLVKQHNRCAGCRISFNLTKHTVDHVIPLSLGGSNWPSNLQLLCGPCNDSKGAKSMDVWIAPIRNMVIWAIH